MCYIDSICIIAAEWSKKIRVTGKSSKFCILIMNLTVKREEIWEISWHRFLFSWKFLGWNHKLCWNLPWVILTHACHGESWYYILEIVQMCPLLSKLMFHAKFFIKIVCVHITGEASCCAVFWYKHAGMDVMWGGIRCERPFCEEMNS